MAQELQFKWNGKELSVSAEPGETLEDVKRKLEEQTHVGAKRQKLLGLKTKDGKMAGDSALVADLAVKPGTRIMLMGCARRSGRGAQPPRAAALAGASVALPGARGARSWRPGLAPAAQRPAPSLRRRRSPGRSPLAGRANAARPTP
jgi:hypothetical protein